VSCAVSRAWLAHTLPWSVLYGNGRRRKGESSIVRFRPNGCATRTVVAAGALSLWNPEVGLVSPTPEPRHQTLTARGQTVGVGVRRPADWARTVASPGANRPHIFSCLSVSPPSRPRTPRATHRLWASPHGPLRAGAITAGLTSRVRVAAAAIGPQTRFSRRGGARQDGSPVAHRPRSWPVLRPDAHIRPGCRLCGGDPRMGKHRTGGDVR
jgi:hypothetical protein